MSWLRLYYVHCWNNIIIIIISTKQTQVILCYIYRPQEHTVLRPNTLLFLHLRLFRCFLNRCTATITHCHHHNINIRVVVFVACCLLLLLLETVSFAV